MHTNIGQHQRRHPVASTITTARAQDHSAQAAIGLSGQSNNADVGNPGGHQAVVMGATGGGCRTT